MGVTSHFTPELLDKEELWARSIAAKLWESGRPDLSAPLESCHATVTHCLCQSCHKSHQVLNHCDRFYCPMCTPRLSYRRRLSIEFWASAVPEPKHLVLTVRNRNSLSKTYVQFFTYSLQRLRRSKLFRTVRGGLQSLELTNEGRGWHLHCHLLVDSPYLDSAHLARVWARLVGQDFAIVAIRDCHERSYLQEVTKYTLKGSEAASLRPYELVEYIEAFTGIRTFTVFGTLFKDRCKRNKLLELLKGQGQSCPACGNYDFWYLSNSEMEYYSTTGKLPWQSLS